jgi:hypothetical protein
MIEYQYFKVINTCNATPRGARQRGWRLRISFPAPMIEYQYFKVINTCNATPRGVRQRGWRLQISFPAPMFIISKSLIQCISFNRHQGLRDLALASSHFIFRYNVYIYTTQNVGFRTTLELQFNVHR